MDTCSHDEILPLIHFCWWYYNWNKINFGEKGGSKHLAKYPKMVHFDENPIFRSDPISRFRLITIWILDMVKSGLIFSDDERWISLNIFIKFFNEWKAITSGRVQAAEFAGSYCEDWTDAYLF